jgi:hypothetical protein
MRVREKTRVTSAFLQRKPAEYESLSIADLSTDHYQSRLRNKLIAEAFYLTKNIEKINSKQRQIPKHKRAGLEPAPTCIRNSQLKLLL